MNLVKQENVFGVHLRQKREDRGWSQDRLAEKTGFVCTKSFISQIETNKYPRADGSPMQPKLEIVDALAEALGEPKNEFRKLAGYPPEEDELLTDEVAEKFSYTFAKYKNLSPRAQVLLDQHVSSTIDFLIEAERLQPGEEQVSAARPRRETAANAPTDSTDQTINILPLESIPVMTREELQDARARPGSAAKKEKKLPTDNAGSSKPNYDE